METEHVEKQIFVFPKKPQIVCKPGSFSETALITNHFLVNMTRAPKQLYCWSMKTEPRIEFNNRKLRQDLLEQASQKINQCIGSHVDTGFEIFTDSNKENQINYIFSELIVDSQSYSIILKFQREIEFQQSYQDEQKKNIAMRFLNAQIKKSFKQLKYTQIGKLPRFFKIENKKKVEGTQYCVYQGFQTSFNFYESGLLLRVDTANKIINDITVLEMIDKLYSSMGNHSKEDIRHRIRETLVGKVVVADYGNFGTYKVLDIVFDQKLSETFFTNSQGDQVSLIDHFKKRYQIQIKNDSQPLIKSDMLDMKKELKEVFLVPEIMKMSGFLDEINDFQKRQVLKVCNKMPGDKVKLCQNLIQEINQGKVQTQLKAIGIEIENQLYSFKGKRLKNPAIFFGDKQLDDNRVSNFQMKNDKFVKTRSQGPLKWLMIYHREGFDKKQFEDLFISNTKSYNFSVDPPTYQELGNKGKILDEIMVILKNQLSQDPYRFDMVIVLLGKKYKNDYGKIKKEITIKYNIASQFIISDNLQKNTGSVLGKIIQQLASKTGGYPWAVKCFECDNSFYEKPFILIGASVTKDKIHKKHTVASVVCTMNPNASSFYNESVYQEDGSDLIHSIKEIVKQCCIKYYRLNNVKPARIIYMRDGINPSGYNSFNMIELQDILNAPVELDATYKPEIAVCLIDRKPTQKFFVQSSNNASNPQYGTVIDSKIINDKDQYEFKMIPQVVSEKLGCATPTQYTFVYHETTLSREQMQSLIYSQCFNYSNWNGPVRVPSVVQYAIKCGQLISAHIHEALQKNNLNDVLWFL